MVLKWERTSAVLGPCAKKKSKKDLKEDLLFKYPIHNLLHNSIHEIYLCLSLISWTLLNVLLYTLISNSVTCVLVCKLIFTWPVYQFETTL